MRFLRQDLHTLTGIYALDALDNEKELNRFNRHLNRCQSCAGEVRGFREVATAMAFATATDPPPEIRTHARPRRTRAWAPWVPWLSGAVAVVAIVVAVLFGFALAHTQTELNQARAQNQALALDKARIAAELDQARAHDQVLAAILGAPHVTLLSQRTTKGGLAVVVLDAATRQLIVATSGLPALPPGQVYQLWLIGPVKIVSAGLLPAAESGVTPPVVATGIVKGDKLGLTVEPAPGTAQPTTKPILALPLPV